MASQVEQKHGPGQGNKFNGSAEPNPAVEAGFTLIEVIAVLVIASILAAAVAFGSRTTGGTAQLKAMAGSVAAGLRHTRGRAIKRGREIVAKVDVGRRRIHWGTERAALALRGIGVKATTAASERKGNVAGIRFFPNGSSTGGRLQLSTDNARYDVAINWLTGRVSIEQAK